jgi:hypothetical protein
MTPLPLCVGTAWSGTACDGGEAIAGFAELEDGIETRMTGTTAATSAI